MEFLAEVLRLAPSALKISIIELLMAEVGEDLAEEPETLHWIQGILDRGRSKELAAAA